MSNLQKTAKRLVAFHRSNGSLSYCDHKYKESFHRRATFLLKKIRDALGESGEVRSNKAGVAVSGKIILETPNMFLQLNESSLFNGGLGIMYRTTNESSRAYYHGRNRFCTLKAFAEHCDKYIVDMKTMRD